jgi:hypothetical protein
MAWLSSTSTSPSPSCPLLEDCSPLHLHSGPQQHHLSLSLALEQFFWRERHCRSIFGVRIRDENESRFIPEYQIGACPVYDIVMCLLERAIIGTPVSLAGHALESNLQGRC